MLKVTRQKALGNRGETIAADYLKRSGHEIIHRNIKISYREIDLITSIGNLIIFVEVKTRSADAASLVDTLITRRQQQNLKKAITGYCRKNKLSFEYVRLDLISVTVPIDNSQVKLIHFQDIF